MIKNTEPELLNATEKYPIDTIKNLETLPKDSYKNAVEGKFPFKNWLPKINL